MTLDKKSAVETLIRCCVVAQAKGNFNLKDGALIYRIVLFLRGGVDEGLQEKTALDTLVSAVVLGNSRGSFTLEESATIDKVVTFLAENDLVTVADKPKPETPVAKPTPEAAPEPKIVEI